MKKQINIILNKIKKLDKKKVIMVSIMLFSVIAVYLVPVLIKRYEELPEVRLRNMQNKGMFAIMIPDDSKEGEYKKYENKEFPTGYKLNTTKSYCIDKDGQAVEDSVSIGTLGRVNIRTNKEVYCTLYYDYPEAALLIYDNHDEKYTTKVTVQDALDELYTVIH